MNQKQQWLKQIPISVGHYLAGFVDGEGSFVVSLRRRDDHTMKWQVVLGFSVAQKDKTVLALLKKHLGCGKLNQREDGVWVYIVMNPLAINERVIPFFNRFNFLSSKTKRNFSIFSKIARLVNSHSHLTSEGLKEIIQLREKLNKGKGRKRKYSLQDYLNSLSENPQRLYARPRIFRKEK